MLVKPDKLQELDGENMIAFNDILSLIKSTEKAIESSELARFVFAIACVTIAPTKNEAFV